jgi:hypothetical protein
VGAPRESEANKKSIVRTVVQEDLRKQKLKFSFLNFSPQKDSFLS